MAGGERAGRQVAGQLRPCGGEGRRSFGQFVAARRLDESGLVLWKFDGGLVGVWLRVFGHVATVGLSDSVRFICR